MSIFGIKNILWYVYNKFTICNNILVLILKIKMLWSIINLSVEYRICDN